MHASASTGNSGSSRLCSLARMVTRLGVRGQGRLANQRASPSAHVGAVNDEHDKSLTCVRLQGPCMGYTMHVVRYYKMKVVYDEYEATRMTYEGPSFARQCRKMTVVRKLEPTLGATRSEENRCPFILQVRAFTENFQNFP
ncbi:hypothetical protein Tco_1152804 [Tanacetum coccineum]